MAVLTPQEIEAFKFAARAHKGQVRMNTTIPYVIHPRRVALHVKALGYSSDMVKAAFLHDTLEDTPTTYIDLVNEFGPAVADLVVELTTPESEAKRSVRIDHEIVRLSKVSDAAKIIKCMDIYDNVTDISGMKDRKFALQYVGEKRRIVPALEVPDDDFPYRVTLAKVEEVYDALRA